MSGSLEQYKNKSKGRDSIKTGKPEERPKHCVGADRTPALRALLANPTAQRELRPRSGIKPIAPPRRRAA